MQAPPGSVGHLKPLVGGVVFALQPDVFGNRLIRDVPTTHDEVAASPQTDGVPKTPSTAADDPSTTDATSSPFTVCITQLGDKCGGRPRSRWT